MITLLLYCLLFLRIFFFFFFNDTATTEIYTLSLHDALPICKGYVAVNGSDRVDVVDPRSQSITKSIQFPQFSGPGYLAADRSEEHTSELQSPCNLVCRLLLEKKKKKR